MRFVREHYRLRGALGTLNRRGAVFLSDAMVKLGAQVALLSSASDAHSSERHRGSLSREGVHESR